MSVLWENICQTQVSGYLELQCMQENHGGRRLHVKHTKRSWRSNHFESCKEECTYCLTAFIQTYFPLHTYMNDQQTVLTVPNLEEEMHMPANQHTDTDSVVESQWSSNFRYLLNSLIHSQPASHEHLLVHYDANPYGISLSSFHAWLALNWRKPQQQQQEE